MSAEGWYRDPYQRHQDRWFSAGKPSALVRDGAVEAQDPPPDYRFEGEPVPVPTIEVPNPYRPNGVDGYVGVRSASMGQGLLRFVRHVAPMMALGIGIVVVVAIITKHSVASGVVGGSIFGGLLGLRYWQVSNDRRDRREFKAMNWSDDISPR